MRRVVVVLAVLAVAALACNVAGVSPSDPGVVQTEDPPPQTLDSGPVQPVGGSSELSPDRIDQITQASVQIVAAQSRGGALESMWTGSGTIISPDGQIVTNCHVACGAPVLLILMTSNPDQPPEPRFQAEITHFDDMLDLALLRITGDAQGNPVTPSALPFLELGNSDSLRLGDRLYIFGYPGVGGETITFTSGSVSGFESASLAGTSRRVIIKTDAEIASGNSGGTAVDPQGRLVAIPTAVNSDVREGVTLGGIGILRPANLIEMVRQQAGSPPPLEGAALPPENDPDPYEPNNTLETATGPLPSGETIAAYISWPEDVDVYWINTSTTAPIVAALRVDDAFNIDYDLYLLNGQGDILAASESETSDELIEYVPPTPGRYWVAVVSYSGSSTTYPYTLAVTYDGGASGGAAASGGIIVTGQAVDGNTGRALPGGMFGALRPDITCSAFFSRSTLDMSLVVASGETNNAGYFQLNGVPRGATYPAFFIYNNNYVCENGWLEVPADAVDSDLGTIEMSFN